MPTTPGVSSPLAGTVRREVFRSDDGGFAVLHLLVQGEGPVTVTGPLPQATAGEEIEVEGEWVQVDGIQQGSGPLITAWAVDGDVTVRSNSW